MILAASDNFSDPRSITVFLLAIAAMLGLARLMGELARKLRQPSVLGEIIAGILLGPTVLGLLYGGEIHAWLFPTSGETAIALEGLITISASLLLLAAGLEVDLSVVRRQGIATLYVGFIGLALPAAMGFGTAWFFPEFLNGGEPIAEILPFALFVGIALSITALPVIAKILIDLNISKSDMGMLILSSAMLNDIIGWVGFAIVLALLPHDGGATAADTAGGATVAKTILYTFLFIGGMVTLGRWIFHHMLVYVQAKWSYPGGVLAFVMVVAMLCSALTEFIGIHSIFGAFIAGVALGDSRHLRHRTRDMINQFIMNIFAPLFFVSIGLRINFLSALSPMVLLLMVVVFAIAFSGKVLGCIWGARLAKMSSRESAAVGFGMAAQGTMGIILGQLALAVTLIDDQLMVAIVAMALLTSLLAGPLMQITLKLSTRKRLADVLSDKQVLVDIVAVSAKDAIDVLSARAAEITGLEPQIISQTVWQREQIMRTGLPNYLAVPHGRLKDLKKPLVILGQSDAGVDFDAPDGTLSRIICLLLTPEDQPESQIELIRIVAEAIGDDKTRANVLDADSRTEVLAALNLSRSENEHAG